MNTSGHGNDSLIIFIPLGVLLAVMVILTGGPAEAAEAINDFVREIVREAAAFVSSLV
jgi:hypothetical protein